MTPGIPTTLYFLYFPIFPHNLNPPYFSLFFHDFWPKNPIFSPWLHLGQIILRVYACKGAYKRHQALTVVNYVLSVSTITTRINGIL